MVEPGGTQGPAGSGLNRARADQRGRATALLADVNLGTGRHVARQAFLYPDDWHKKYGYDLQVEWSPDSTNLAASSANTPTRIFHAATGSVWVVYPSDPTYPADEIDPAINLRGSPDSLKLAVNLYGGDILVMDVASRTAKMVLSHTDEMVEIRWFPDSRRLMTGSYEDATINIIDVIGKP